MDIWHLVVSFGPPVRPQRISKPPLAFRGTIKMGPGLINSLFQGSEKKDLLVRISGPSMGTAQKTKQKEIHTRRDQQHTAEAISGPLPIK